MYQYGSAIDSNTCLAGFLLFPSALRVTFFSEGDEEARSAMTDQSSAALPGGLTTEITKSLSAVWAHYAGVPPTNPRTEIRGNVVTCVLVDAVGDYNKSLADARQRDNAPDAAKLTDAYRSAAISAITSLTRQRVNTFLSSHDADTDVATEVFILEPSLGRGAPGLADRWFGAGGLSRGTSRRKGFREARKAGRFEKVRDDEENTAHFRLTDQ
jgi:hypothetical protein